MPASTFKIANALIAIDAKVIRGAEHVLAWGGETRWNANWNRDHTLASAMRHSVVWYFQKIARDETWAPSATEIPRSAPLRERRPGPRGHDVLARGTARHLTA